MVDVVIAFVAEVPDALSAESLGLLRCGVDVVMAIYYRGRLLHRDRGDGRILWQAPERISGSSGKLIRLASLSQGLDIAPK